MSWIQDISAEQLARLFHHYREALTDDSENSGAAHSSWEGTSEQERKLMVAAARLALLELEATSSPERANRKYFAKPGEADWGC